MFLMAACASILLVSCGKDGGEGEKEEPVVQNTWPESGFSGNNYWYLSNGAVQIGVDLSRGGCVFHFSEKGTKRNLINHYDNGRFIQQSYYDGKTDGSVWNGKNWRWNPIQGGGWKEGTGAKIIKREKKRNKHRNSDAARTLGHLRGSAGVRHDRNHNPGRELCENPL